MRFTVKMKNENFSPQLLFFFLGISVTVLFYCFSDGISGNDFWWHIKAGEWIVENGRVPDTDIFSWIGKERELSWTAHEWLSEVIFYIVYALCGETGIYLMSLFCAVFMVIFLFWTARDNMRRNFLLGGSFFIFLAVTESSFFYGRPHIFSFFLLAAELKILYGFYENPKDRKIYLLPFLASLWSNLHGGSSNLSYLLCFLFLGISVLHFQCGRVRAERMSRSGIKRLAVVSAFTMGAVALNPFGMRMLVYPYTNMLDDFMLSVISEWQAPDVKNAGALLFYFLPIVLMSIGFFTEKRDIRLLDVIMMGFFLYLFFRSVRFIMLWYIAAPFYAFPYLPEMKNGEIRKHTEKIAVCVCGIILLLLMENSIYLIGRTLNGGEVISTVVSEKMIEAIQQDQPQRLFNDYNTGETLIYHDVEVFIDSRADVYSTEHILEDAFSLLFLQQRSEETEEEIVDVEALMGKYQFDALLVLKSRPLYVYLLSHPEEFTLISEDEEMGYFRVKG
ncbi:MAG: hypothetical protein LUH58_08540 [Lachnospiraceae bacterium]|nr:hypothetical protein [Lachnospiraceae bacterium]